MPMPKPPYPPEFQAEAVRLVKESGKKMVEVARDLGVSVASLRHWVKQHEIDAGDREGLTTIRCAECWVSPPVGFMRGKSEYSRPEPVRMQNLPS